MTLKCIECALPADITIESADGSIFHSHSTNLSMFSEGFPPAAIEPLAGEIVKMTESTEVVKILLQFMHAQRQPDLRKLSIECLAGVAEASEKYMVYPAMQACSLRMQTLIGEYPLEVLTYGTKFDYPELSDEAAPLTLGVGTEVARKTLDAGTFGAWVTYRDKRETRIRSAITAKPNLYVCHPGRTDDSCHANWDAFQKEVVFRCWGTSVATWEERMWESLFLLGKCACCHKAVRKWEEGIWKACTDAGKFSAFL
ncbi:hypothetical protein BDQ17DRAFT_1288650 [Cyathus striatus]|nr:hypothetical protein BDQ17DRAFT_1288650 [Cyathus striatus]